MFVRMFDTIQQLTFDLVVCDEGHRLKNTTIKTTSVSLFHKNLALGVKVNVNVTSVFLSHLHSFQSLSSIVNLF